MYTRAPYAIRRNFYLGGHPRALRGRQGHDAVAPIVSPAAEAFESFPLEHADRVPSAARYVAIPRAGHVTVVGSLAREGVAAETF